MFNRKYKTRYSDKHEFYFHWMNGRRDIILKDCDSPKQIGISIGVNMYTIVELPIFKNLIVNEIKNMGPRKYRIIVK